MKEVVHWLSEHGFQHLAEKETKHDDKKATTPATTAVTTTGAASAATALALQLSSATIPRSLYAARYGPTGPC